MRSRICEVTQRHYRSHMSRNGLLDAVEAPSSTHVARKSFDKDKDVRDDQDMLLSAFVALNTVNPVILETD